jgi:hypothetical protein
MIARLIACVVLLSAAGCATTRTSDTTRTAIEQLLISSAVDQALAKVDFGPLAGRAVFVQEKYLDGVDKNYVAGSIRHRVLAAGGKLVEKQEDADIVMEVRSGGIGTDRSESFLGSPQIAVPGPMPVQVPEIQIVTTKTQTATAKLAIVAYDAKTHEAIGSGGTSLARSEDNNWFVLGMGPFNNGNVRTEVASATGHDGVAFELARYLPINPVEVGPPTMAPVNFVPEQEGMSAGPPPGVPPNTALLPQAPGPNIPWPVR